MKKVILIMIFISANIMIFAQEIPTFQSPEAATLGIIGNIPVSYHTGRANISIPLMEIKCGDYTMPVTLSYNSGGLLPDMHPTWVGQNWNLDVGGVITRTVRNLPDELDVTTTYSRPDMNLLHNGVRVMGFLKHSNYEKSYTNFWYNWDYNEWFRSEKGDVYRGNYLYYTPFYSVVGLYCNGKSDEGVPDGINVFSSDSHSFFDTESDEYFISVNGFSGKMYIDKNGTFKVAGHPEIKIEPRETENVDMLKGTIASFNMTMPDGIQYIFGNSYIETTASSSEDNANDNNNQCKVATSWLLNSIILPNDETIVFNYKNKVYDKTYTSSFLQAGTTAKSNCADGESYSYQNIWHYYLNSIEGKNFILNFYSSKADDKSIKSNSSNFDNTNWAKLDYMVLRDKQNKKVKRIDFDYQNRAGGVPSRLYLSSLTEEGKSPYLFHYNDNQSLDYVTGGRDLWGYYNGNGWTPMDCYKNISPYGEFDFNKDYFPDCRKTNPNVITKGMLKEITYPTGGKVEFEFEANTYARIFRMEMNSNGLTYTSKIINSYPITYAGGTRIKKITYKDSDNKVEYIREYDYTKMFTHEEYETPPDVLTTPYTSYIPASSGILGVMPALVHKIDFYDDNNKKYIYSSLQSEPFTPTIVTNGSYVGYSQVTEKIKDKNGNLQGYTVYKYTNFDTNPDSPPTVSQPPFYYRDFFRPNSKEEERGQLLSKTDFSFDDKLVKEEKYKYLIIKREGFRGLEIKSIPCREFHKAACAIYEISNNSYLPSIKEEIFYDNNGNETQKSVETYTYNNYNLLTTIATTNSDGQNLLTINKYSTDFGSATPYNKMVEKNILSPVVQQIACKDYLIDMVAAQSAVPTVNYDLQFIPKRVLFGEYRAFAEYSSSSGKFYKPQSVSYLLNENNITTTNYSQYWKQKMSFTYTDFGKIFNAVDSESGFSTVYLWGYNNQYPIIKIENATLYQIKNLIDEKYWKQANKTLNPNDFLVYKYDEQFYANKEMLKEAYNNNSTENQPVNIAVRFDGFQEIKNVEEFNQFSEDLVLLPAVNLTNSNEENSDNSSDIYLSLNGLRVVNNHIDIGSITHIDTSLLEYAVDKVSKTDSDIITLGETLRAALPDAWVWTYTHKPLVGVTSITDPHGVTITFEYDEFGRLKNTKDSDLKLLQEYNYHYINQ